MAGHAASHSQRISPALSESFVTAFHRRSRARSSAKPLMTHRGQQHCGQSFKATSRLDLEDTGGEHQPLQSLNKRLHVVS
jgi:hypothetical protein